MENKIRYVLKHKETGLYLGYSPDNPTTKNLFKAKRFPSEEYYQLWMQTSPYAPEPNKYKLIPVNMTIEEVIPDVPQEREHFQDSSGVGRL